MRAEPPIPLNSAARGFWDRHHDRLTAAGLLTAADVDTFTVLCVIFSKLAAVAVFEPGEENFREMVQFNQLGKQYREYAREFGLAPRDRKRSKLDAEPPAPKDEFDL